MLSWSSLVSNVNFLFSTCCYSLCTARENTRKHTRFLLLLLSFDHSSSFSFLFFSFLFPSFFLPSNINFPFLVLVSSFLFLFRAHHREGVFLDAVNRATETKKAGKEAAFPTLAALARSFAYASFFTANLSAPCIRRRLFSRFLHVRIPSFFSPSSSSSFSSFLSFFFFFFLRYRVTRGRGGKGRVRVKGVGGREGRTRRDDDTRFVGKRFFFISSFSFSKRQRNSCREFEQRFLSFSFFRQFERGKV